MMAADSRMVIRNDSFKTEISTACTKLIRTREWIIGAAGDNDDITRFFDWVRKGRKAPRRKVTGDFEALMLSRQELLHFSDDGDPDAIRDGYMAIGSGGPVALGALTGMALVGVDPDPRIAVMAACQHDANTREPIDFLRWK
jgi:hypothetical protein